MEKIIKLTVELIPASNFYNNIRSSLTKSQWDLIRKDSYLKANHKCEICHQTGKEQGYKNIVECHEIWDYDFKNKKQRLKGLISLCTRCHLCKHIGRAFAVGKQAEVFKHMELVNNWNHKELVMYLVKIFKEHKLRSKIPWELDLTYLKINYGIDKLTLAKGAKVKPKKPKYYKKKRSRN
jgi:hypothetical protein